jgi:hypothetical protein
MPRLNRHGQATTGYGVSWFDDTRTIHQDCSSGVCVIRLSDGTLLAEHGCNVVYAQQGTWVSFLATGPDRGVHTSRGEHFEDAALGDPKPLNDCVGPDGAIAIKVRYHSAGPWDVLEADGSRWRLTEGDARFVSLLGDRRAVWTDGGRLRTTPGLSLRHVPDGQVWWPRVVGDVLLYQHESGALVLDGKVIGTSGNYFRPDLMRVDGGWLVVWSSNEGESDVLSRTVTDAELEALPRIGEQPKPTPEPKPQPEPDKEPTPVPTSPNLLSVVLDAARDRADLITRNTFESLGQFIAYLVPRLRAADPSGDWGGVGKTDGEAGFMLPNGVRVSHDVVFSRTRNEQFKVTAYSAANSHNNSGKRPGDSGYVEPGPAQPMWHFIPREHYRPNNPWVSIVTGGDEDDPGDSEPKPGPGPAADPRNVPIIAEFMRGQIITEGAIAALRALKPPPTPAPHVCPTPRWPDDHECPAGPSWPPLAEIVALKESWHAAFGQRLDEGQLVHLLYMHFAERQDAAAIAVNVYLVEGTWGGQEWVRWDSPLRKHLHNRGIRVAGVIPWSYDVGGVPGLWASDKHSDWRAGGYTVAQVLHSLPYADRNLWCHSHGGQLPFFAAGVYQCPIRRLVTFATPFRKDMESHILQAKWRIGYWTHVAAADWDFTAWAGGVFDGQLWGGRAQPHADLSIRPKGIGHSKLLKDPDHFEHLDGLIDITRAAALQGERVVA